LKSQFTQIYRIALEYLELYIVLVYIHKIIKEKKSQSLPLKEEKVLPDMEEYSKITMD